MKRTQQASSWVVDYSAARAHAIRWLGDRYLLARPINARHQERPPTPGTGLAAPADGPLAAKGRVRARVSRSG